MTGEPWHVDVCCWGGLEPGTVYVHVPNPFTTAGICTPPPEATVIVEGTTVTELTPVYSTCTLFCPVMLTVQTVALTESQPAQATKGALVTAGAVNVTVVPAL